MFDLRGFLLGLMLLVVVLLAFGWVDRQSPLEDDDEPDEPQVIEEDEL